MNCKINSMSCFLWWFIGKTVKLLEICECPINQSSIIFIIIIIIIFIIIIVTLVASLELRYNENLVSSNLKGAINFGKAIIIITYNAAHIKHKSFSRAMTKG